MGDTDETQEIGIVQDDEGVRNGRISQNSQSLAQV